MAARAPARGHRRRDRSRQRYGGALRQLGSTSEAARSSRFERRHPQPIGGDLRAKTPTRCFICGARSQRPRTVRSLVRRSPRGPTHQARAPRPETARHARPLTPASSWRSLSIPRRARGDRRPAAADLAGDRPADVLADVRAGAERMRSGRTRARSSRSRGAGERRGAGGAGVTPTAVRVRQGGDVAQRAGLTQAELAGGGARPRRPASSRSPRADPTGSRPARRRPISAPDSINAARHKRSSV